MKLASIAEVQPIFAIINCKDSDYCGIIGIFIDTFGIVYEVMILKYSTF
jgi:hypothetical protein